MRRMWSRLRAMLARLVDRGAGDQELSEELRAFVERDTDSKIRSGVSPEAARRAALIELGGAERVKELVREARAGARWDGVFRDIRYAIRSLGRSPLVVTPLNGSSWPASCGAGSQGSDRAVPGLPASTSPARPL